MKLYIYKTQDMSGEPLMSFNVTETPKTLNINGLASNTPYWIKVIDDNGLEAEINSGNGCEFSTLNYNNEQYDSSGYHIVLEKDGFYLYLGKEKELNTTNLTYTYNNSTTKWQVDKFPIPIRNYNDYITIYLNNNLIAISEKVLSIE